MAALLPGALSLAELAAGGIQSLVEGPTTEPLTSSQRAEANVSLDPTTGSGYYKTPSGSYTGRLGLPSRSACVPSELAQNSTFYSPPRDTPIADALSAYGSGTNSDQNFGEQNSATSGRRTRRPIPSRSGQAYSGRPYPPSYPGESKDFLPDTHKQLPVFADSNNRPIPHSESDAWIHPPPYQLATGTTSSTGPGTSSGPSGTHGSVGGSVLGGGTGGSGGGSAPVVPSSSGTMGSKGGGIGSFSKSIPAFMFADIAGKLANTGLNHVLTQDRQEEQFQREQQLRQDMKTQRYMHDLNSGRYNNRNIQY